MALTPEQRRYQRTWKKTERDARVAAGLCTGCLRELDTGTVDCVWCRDQRQDRHKANMARQARPCTTAGCQGKATPRSKTGRCLACARAAKTAAMLAARKDTGVGRTYTDQGATFSDNRKHRYTLWREWAGLFRAGEFTSAAHPGGTVLWVMLNPSTADELVLDPTIRRCEDFTKRWGYTRLVVCNLFSWRSTDPRMLYQGAGVTGDPENLDEIMGQAIDAARIVCAWGTHGRYLHRGRQVLDILQAPPTIAAKLRHLGLNQDGSPKHPLYVPGDTPLGQW